MSDPTDDLVETLEVLAAYERTDGRVPVARALAAAAECISGLEAERTDLIERLEKANETIGVLALNRFPNDPERTRLEGKAEGVRLALSYMEEARRG